MHKPAPESAGGMPKTPEAVIGIPPDTAGSTGPVRLHAQPERTPQAGSNGAADAGIKLFHVGPTWLLMIRQVYHRFDYSVNATFQKFQQFE